MGGKLLVARLLLHQHERTAPFLALLNVSAPFKCMESLMDAGYFQSAQFGDFHGFTFLILVEESEHGCLDLRIKLSGNQRM